MNFGLGGEATHGDSSSRPRIIRASALVLALVFFASGCAHDVVVPAEHGSRSLVLGDVIDLDSKILAEHRVINVYVPPGYSDAAESKNTYPVLYMADGGLKEDFTHVMGLVDISVKNETMRPFILVGIENTERRRDLVSKTSIDEEKKIAPHAGGTENFRRFLREELKPLIAAHYRTSRESAFVGESFAGLFAVETLVVDPDLFDSYVAVSPSLWWNDEALAKSVANLPSSWPGPSKSLFLATAGDEGSYQAGSNLVVATLREKKPAGLRFEYVAMPDEKHATIFHPAALKAFRMLFGPMPKTST